MKPLLSYLPALIGTIAATLGGAVHAASPDDLRQWLDQGEAVTVIDIRSAARFQAGHIPGAIHVSTTLLPHKSLPRLGRVVVCGEGLGFDPVDGAVAALNLKPGIVAEELIGGFAAWEDARGTTTQAPGVHPETLKQVTYQQLQQADFSKLVLVDLRQPPALARQSADVGAAPRPLTDLRSAFPQAVVSSSAFQLPQARQDAGSGTAAAPVLVLIDSDGTSAAETARILKANGRSRVVILAGGEGILARQGRPGLDRAATATEATPTAK